MDLRSLKTTQLAAPEAQNCARFSPWCFSRSKRFFDCAASAIGLIVGAPLMLLVGIALKLSEPGAPVLFRHRRVGEGGREFDLLKFRTMRSSGGSNLTSANDNRVTTLGGVLRRTKLDELPQLVNVLVGDMSLVGPRPDTKDFVASLSPQLIDVLLLTPGITGAASLRFRNEEALFAQVPPEKLTQHYIEVVLPEKVRLDIDYAGKATFLSDLRILVRTVAALAD